MRPLSGITVVTLEHAIAAPFATRQLADLGARVIKVERPGVGDFARGYDERMRGLASQTADEVLRRLDDAQIANEQVNDMHDVWQHPQLRARKRWREIDSPSGRIPALLPPGAENGRRAGAWPAHEFHSRESRLFRGRDRRTEAGTCDLIRNLAPQRQP